MDYTSFEVGAQFPLPIKAAGDGGMFQVDTNGIMFILRLSRTDIIAVEAFRTGEAEIALAAENGALFFLYRIDGIFKDGWGDAPLTFSGMKKENLPDIDKLKDKTLFLYLVDARLNVLLAMRQVTLDDDFFAFLSSHVKKTLAALPDELTERQKIAEVWQRYTSAELRERAKVVQTLPLSIAPPSVHT